MVYKLEIVKLKKQETKQIVKELRKGWYWTAKNRWEAWWCCTVKSYSFSKGCNCPIKNWNGSEGYGMIRLTIMFLIIYVHWEVVLWTPINSSHLVITTLSLLFCYSYQLWILLKKYFWKNCWLAPHFSFSTFGFITKICTWTYGL